MRSSYAFTGRSRAICARRAFARCLAVTIRKNRAIRAAAVAFIDVTSMPTETAVSHNASTSMRRRSRASVSRTCTRQYASSSSSASSATRYRSRIMRMSRCDCSFRTHHSLAYRSSANKFANGASRSHAARSCDQPYSAASAIPRRSQRSSIGTAARRALVSSLMTCSRSASSWRSTPLAAASLVACSTTARRSSSSVSWIAARSNVSSEATNGNSPAAMMPLRRSDSASMALTAPQYAASMVPQRRIDSSASSDANATAVASPD
mmetsp:Transcript_29673/g.91628  ORF Transcript_29673/g.91628 Transcript_29673/m.91628 type:complete len:265 (+) Transcript_29673:84-878(+)